MIVLFVKHLLKNLDGLVRRISHLLLLISRGICEPYLMILDHLIQEHIFPEILVSFLPDLVSAKLIAHICHFFGEHLDHGFERIRVLSLFILLFV